MIIQMAFAKFMLLIVKLMRVTLHAQHAIQDIT